ncbi:hypothetical protein J1TS3_28810 [Siminovitchia fordii]|uniref:Uncharacterized protein n=1 Tax=Siminovitchia fordii TaxID=254759 RepID=A0ABQ4K7N9_9BACI|nr:hypothetical protein J1TS3_28810 [Siminovitchia fordii]
MEKIAGEDCGRALFNKPPKEQGPKNPLEQISQAEEPHSDATLESVVKRHQRRKPRKSGLNTQVQGQRREQHPFLFFYET